MALPIALREHVRRRLWRFKGWTDVETLRRGGAHVGIGVFIGANTFVDPDFGFLVTIGDGASISVDVTVLAHDASTKAETGMTRVAPVSIGRQAFIGAGSIILPGVTIGDRAIVGAGSIVRRSVPDDTVVAGNPARPIVSAGDYADRHKAALHAAPSWPRQGWTASTGITPERIVQMRERLRHVGEGYIQ